MYQQTKFPSEQGRHPIRRRDDGVLQGAMTRTHLDVGHRALQDAIITAPDRMPASIRRKLALLMDRVILEKKKGAR